MKEKNKRIIKKIPKNILKQIEDINDTCDVYYKPLVSKIFWHHLSFLVKQIAKRDTVLDFGGGNGILLPTLSKMFKEVICLDLFTEEAEKIKKIYKLNNVKIIQSDILKKEFPKDKFDCIIASNVLEHFPDLSYPLKQIKKWLNPSGQLLISGPSENFCYRLGRKLINLESPPDHYQTCSDIIREVGKEFKISKIKFLPFNFLGKHMSIFVFINAGKKSEENS